MAPSTGVLDKELVISIIYCKRLCFFFVIIYCSKRNLLLKRWETKSLFENESNFVVSDESIIYLGQQKLFSSHEIIMRSCSKF